MSAPDASLGSLGDGLLFAAVVIYALAMLGYAGEQASRKARTALTCITLIMLTFTVLAFTSIVEDLRFNQVPAPGKPAYSGIRMRDPNWNSLEDVDDLPEQLRKEIGHFFDVYKDLDPDRHSEVNGWGNREAAWERIAQAREAWAKRTAD